MIIHLILIKYLEYGICSANDALASFCAAKTTDVLKIKVKQNKAAIFHMIVIVPLTQRKVN